MVNEELVKKVRLAKSKRLGVRRAFKTFHQRVGGEWVTVRAGEIIPSELYAAAKKKKIPYEKVRR